MTIPFFDEKIADRGHQSIDIMASRFDVYMQTVIPRGLRRNRADAGQSHAVGPRHPESEKILYR
jgi:hypothetical protein